MRIIIVGRDRELLEPLIEKLTGHNFEVMVVENSAGVLSYIKQNSIQFLMADSSLLVGHTLAKEVQSRCPLARMIVLAARPSLLRMIEALSHGLADYFPRTPENFDNIIKTILSERDRIIRWQHVLLADSPAFSTQEPEGEDPVHIDDLQNEMHCLDGETGHEEGGTVQ